MVNNAQGMQCKSKMTQYVTGHISKNSFRNFLLNCFSNFANIKTLLQSIITRNCNAVNVR